MEQPNTTTCAVCGRVFSSNKALQEHQRNVHASEARGQRPVGRDLELDELDDEETAA